VTVQIGTPPQVCSLLLATASPDTWVVSAAASNLTSTRKFNASASGTYESNEVEVDIWDLRGVAAGVNSTDDMAVAGETVLSQQFVLVAAEFQYEDFAGDGMLVRDLDRDWD